MTEAPSSNGEFRGDARARLTRIESDIAEIHADIRILKERQDRFLGIIAVGAFIVPILLHFISR